MKINNGDVFDIGQTVNGVSTFVWINEYWYYFTDHFFDKYEYDQQDLTNTVLNLSGLEEITHIKNIFK